MEMIMSKSSSSKFLKRNPSPRVKIEYEVEHSGAVNKVQLPFIMAVFSDLAGTPMQSPEPFHNRKMKEINIYNFDDCMRTISPRLAFSIPGNIEDNTEITVDITFESMEDFLPGVIAGKVAGLDQFLEQRTQLSSLITYMDGPHTSEELVGQILKDEHLLKQIASKGLSSCEQVNDLFVKEFKSISDQAKEVIEKSIQTVAEWVLADSSIVSGNVVYSIEAIIVEIDKKLSQYINLILHHPDFQCLEGAWRGLHYLVNNTETDEMLKIHFMSASKKELHKQFKKYNGTCWDHSHVFKILYSNIYGNCLEEPYGCLVGDYHFDHSPPDLEFLTEMAKMSAATHAPFITGVAPSLLQMDSWQELDNLRELIEIFQNTEYEAWHSLRESEDSKYLGLAMPRFLARLPYGSKTDPVEEFDFEEDTGSADHQKYTWANSAYAMALNINRSFKMFGWCTSIRGVESGGAVEGLPTHISPTEDGGVSMMPTEIGTTERYQVYFEKNGINQLLPRKNSDSAAFFSAGSLHKTVEYDDLEAAANASLTANLPYLFPAYRFTHYLKCIIRDKGGSFKKREEMETWLNKWISDYVEPEHQQGRPEEDKARTPLCYARVDLTEIEGFLGGYYLRLSITPCYQSGGVHVPIVLNFNFFIPL
jgi:type VI secretion system protein ImpC